MKIGLDSTCFSDVDLNGDIKADREISFDYLPGFDYAETGEKTGREEVGKEERVENRGASPIQHKFNKNIKNYPLEFQWTVTKGLLMQDYDILVEQDYPSLAAAETTGKSITLSLEDSAP